MPGRTTRSGRAPGGWANGVDYGEGYIGRGPLAWSPDRVGLFLADWLPRKTFLDPDQRAALPEAYAVGWVSHCVAAASILGGSARSLPPSMQ